MNFNFVGIIILGLFGLGVIVWAFATAPDTLQNVRLEEQQQKTEYMQLCADEGISAFNCLNNWMGVTTRD